MDHTPFAVHDADRAAAALLQEMLPRRVFDAHAHCYDPEALPTHRGTGVFRDDAGTPEACLAHLRPFLPGVEALELNLVAMPDPAMNRRPELRRRACDALLRGLQHPGARSAAPYVMAGDDEETVEALAAQPGVRALKCYCYSAGDTDWERCAPGDFLPEAAWAVAQRRSLPILLHLMRPAALADGENFAYIRRMARRYPDARLILAHCARGFAAWTCVERAGGLSDLENVWFDLSAVCEPGPMMACIRATGGRRVVWGSDYPICMHRGRAISLAGGFFWLTGPQLAALQPQGTEPCLLIAENLLAVRQAALLLGLDRTDLDRIFYRNAVELFRLPCGKEQ